MRSMTEALLTALKASIAKAREQGEVRYCTVIDNIQEYFLVREEGIGMQSQLKVGTHGSAIKLEDCAPEAFSLQDHLSRVLKAERRTLTTPNLYLDIDFSHISTLVTLHWVHALIEYIPQLSKYASPLSKLFRQAYQTKRCSPLSRKTSVQPLGTNGEQEVETHGMHRALLDFAAQEGLT
jgi:hypothetical protein